MAKAQSAPQPFDHEQQSLDGAQDVLLAPVRGPDTRRGLPKELFQRRPSRFAVKFLFTLGLIAACYIAIAMAASWILTAATVVVLGLMYAHLVELQHECIHEHAFRSRRWNRLCGFICGLFMLSSHSHYKYEHLRHHALLGTPQNREFFNYRFRGLDSWWGFLRAAFHLGRYMDVFRGIARSCTGRAIPRITRECDLKRIRAEYRLFLAFLLTVTAFTALTGELFAVFAWLLPAILVAEATHFLIELPEHFGLNTQTDGNVLTNTRTINASRFAQWFTNYNNLHTAHHYHQGVPIANMRKLHEVAKKKFEIVEPSYWSFYSNVIHGKIKYQDHAEETCMNR